MTTYEEAADERQRIEDWGRCPACQSVGWIEGTGPAPDQDPERSERLWRAKCVAPEDPNPEEPKGFCRVELIAWNETDGATDGHDSIIVKTWIGVPPPAEERKP